MSPPEPDTIAPLASLDGGPVFDEPWQAEALGLAFSLAESGVFSRAQWSETLGARHRALLTQGAPDTPQTYYEAVVHALEELVCGSGACSADNLDARTRAWRQAYLNTPHGKPVELAAGLKNAGKMPR